MLNIGRRSFVKQTAAAVAAVTLPSSFLFPPAQNKKLCFSTLGCPDWSINKIIEFATAHKYQAIEIRTIERELDLNKVTAFAPANIGATKKLFADHNIKIVDLGSSASLHHTDKVTRQKNIDDAKRYIDLASKLGAGYIRVFPNNLPKDETRTKILDLIVSGLNELAIYSKGSNVKVLMETHGDLVAKDELVHVMKAVNNARAGLIWDIMNAWSVTKETPTDIYSGIKKYIHHVHVKDGTIKDGKIEYTLLGKGEAPIREAVTLLKNDNYKGYYSFEWEKMWHPEIAEPEIALAQFPTEIQSY